MAQITYTNKVALNENPEIADINKVTDDDMNEIKQVVNDNYNNTIQITDTEPSDSDNKIWIDTGEVGSAVSEITNEYSTSTGLGYSANYVNNLFQIKNLWNGNKYTANDTLTLNEELEIGHLYIITCMGVSSSFTVSIPFVYAVAGNIQIAYANVAGSTPEGFRYRLTVNGTTLTISANSQNNIANTAIIRIDKIM